jgi:hypothetical protein
LDTLYRLPRFVCTQTTERQQLRLFGNKNELVLSDRLRLDVAITGNKEMYGWVGANQFEQRNLFDLVGGGTISTGLFGSFLAAVFRVDHPDFSASEPQFWNGQTLRNFDFRVPQERSNYAIGPHGFLRFTSYKGSLSVNPTNGDLVRLVVETDNPPPETRIRDAFTTLDYTHLQVRTSNFLLPQDARLTVTNEEGSESESHTTYANCHEFVGESKLSFDDLPLASAAQLDPQPKILPHQFFTTALAQDIDTARAAAGDPVLLKTTSTIKTVPKKATLPKNSILRGRLIRLQFIYGSTPGLILVLVLENAEHQGKPVPISAAATQVNGKRAPLSLIDRGNVAMISLPKVRPGYVVKGLPIRWVSTPSNVHKSQMDSPAADGK